jgi:FtsH-binding integral membrane protein
MANTFPEVTAVSVEAEPATHYVDWGAIFAGVFVAIAISSVFLAFGSAIGLSLTSFHPPESAPVTGLVIAAGLWLLWVQISSFIGGAYVTGRMRRRIGDAKAHEVTMRDGTHGLIMWAVNIVIGVVLAGWITIAGVSGVVSTAANSGALDYYAERLMRSDAATTAPAVSPDAQYNSQIGRILSRNVAARTVDETDRSYLAREITSRTGLAEADAQKRVDDTLAMLKAQAESARKFGVLIAFLTAASLLVSGVAAWWAATAGGKHRDEGTDHSHFSSWR